MDHTVDPVYIHHVRSINQALTEHGYSPQNSLCKLTFVCLRQTAGRSGELGWLLLESFSYDTFYDHVFVELTESNPSKMKLCVFVTGKTPELCFFTTLGEMFTHNDPDFLKFDGEVVMFFQELNNVKRSGTKICEYWTQLRPISKGTYNLGTYKNVVNHDFDSATAQGFRRGAVNELACSVPLEFAVQTTGHDMKSKSAFFEYLNTSRSMLQNGTVVLGGWDEDD